MEGWKEGNVKKVDAENEMQRKKRKLEDENREERSFMTRRRKEE